MIMITRTIAGIVFLAAFAIGALAQSGEAQAGYGAIAYSPSSGAYGYSYNYPSRYTAESRALNECAARGGGCRVMVWFRNACGALATGAGRAYGWAWNTSRSAARARALAECRARTSGCYIRVLVCS